MRATRRLDWSLSFCLVAGISFLAWSRGAYLGDDHNTLFPVAQHSVLNTVKNYIRPIEYYILQIANSIDFEIWVGASLIMAVTAAIIQLKTVEHILSKRFEWPMAPLLVAASPLWFYVLSQVDTVSQALCNLIFAGAIHLLFTRVLSPGTTRVAGPAALVNVLACLLLYSKELAVVAALLLPAVTTVVVLKRRQVNVLHLASMLFFAIVAVGWLYLKFKYPSQRPEPGGHYNLSPSVRSFAVNLLSVVAFPVTPLPTSFLSFARLRTVWSIVALVSTGYLTVSLWRQAIRHPGVGGVRGLLALLLVCCIPIFYVHSSELYAPLVGGYLIPLLLSASVGRHAAKVAYMFVLLGCSYANAVLYYDTSVVRRMGLARVEYSVYNGPNGIFYNGALVKPLCPIRGTTKVTWCGNSLRCLSGLNASPFSPTSQTCDSRTLP